MALDELTDTILVTQSNSTVLAYDMNGGFKGAASNGIPMEMIAAKSGYACLPQPSVGVVSIWNLHDLQSGQLLPFSIRKNPGNVWMTLLPHDGLVCAVHERSAPSISVISIPDLRLQRTIYLAGLTPLDKLEPFQGGWRLLGFDEGTSKGTAAILSFFDKKVTFVDLERGKQVSTAELRLQPIEATIDRKHGRLIIALFDSHTPNTHFSSVEPQSGKIHDLRAATELFPAGLAVSRDGKTIIVMNGKDVKVLPNE
jgi:hypothetical protein